MLLRRIPPTFAALSLACSWLASAPGGATPAAAATPSAPTGAGASPALHFLEDRFEIRLTPGASRAAEAFRVSRNAGPESRGRAGATSAGRESRIGVAGVDAEAQRAGAWLESEFLGETRPPEGSGEIDFTAFFVVHDPASGTAGEAGARAGPGPDRSGGPGPSATLAEAIQRFAALPEVQDADPIPVLPVEAIPDDSLWSRSSWFFQPGNRHDIHAPEAWDVSTGDSSVVIAIVDTGVLPYHPDLGVLSPSPAGNLWINRAERDGLPGVDDDANGFVDDVWGWDFCAAPPDEAVSSSGEDWQDADNDPNDFVGHGTAVAGLAAALTDNRIGVAGMTWHCRLMALRAGGATTRAPSGEVVMLYAAQAIRYATRMGAAVINCSFASLNLEGLEAAVTAATQAGVIVVSAAGNGTFIPYLGRRADVISVGSTDPDDHVSAFSTPYPEVDLSAPGEGLATITLSRPGADSLGLRQPTYTQAWGTSFSAPLVSGTAALMQADRHARGLKPLTPFGMVLRLWETADDISALNPGVTGYGRGRLNAFRALADPPGSRATRAGGAVIGPAVVLPAVSGGTRVAVATSDRHLLLLSGASGDTVRMADLPAFPAGGVAAADLGGGRGIGMFVGLADGHIAGFDENAEPLPGWPVAGATGSTGRLAEPALGDLDGDGVLEVVWGGSNGRVFAWRASGTPMPGFPVVVGPSGPNVLLALSNLDSLPGVEIVASAGTALHVLRSDGSELPGWPVGFITPGAPVVAWLGSRHAVAVLTTAGTDLWAFDGAGAWYWRAALPGLATQDLAVGDLDLDGSDEFVVPCVNQAMMAAIDSEGRRPPGLGWPRALPGSAIGPPVIGHLSGSGRPGILFRMASVQGGDLMALSANAESLKSFPKPGNAGDFPTLDDLNQDGATDVVAGSARDSSIVFYDAGPGSWSPEPQPWPTPCGNFARTRSRLYAPALAVVDDAPPLPVADLAASAVGPSSVTLSWTAPAEVPAGAAARYELRRSTVPLDSSSFQSGTLVAGLDPPGAPGASQRFAVTGLDENSRFYFALRSGDAHGNWSRLSNVVAVTTPNVAPAAVTDLSVVRGTSSSVTLRWSASGDDGRAGRPSRNELRASLRPFDAAAFDSIALRLELEPRVDGGQPETAVFPGLEPGVRYWFALRARDDAGNRSPLSNLASAQVGPLAGRDGVALASLAQPARTPVELHWQAAAISGAAGSIRIYDLGGRSIRRLRLGSGSDGIVLWDGRDENGRELPAGLYFARLESGPAHAQTRVVLLR